MYWPGGIWGQIKQLTNPRAAFCPLLLLAFKYFLVLSKLATFLLLFLLPRLNGIVHLEVLLLRCIWCLLPISLPSRRRGCHLDIRGRHDDTRRPSQVHRWPPQHWYEGTGDPLPTSEHQASTNRHPWTSNSGHLPSHPHGLRRNLIKKHSPLSPSPAPWEMEYWAQVSMSQ